MSEDIKTLLEFAVHAPSGDNSQPWSFLVKNEDIYLYNLPERDNAILNFNQSGSYISHGAVIENICISASSLGYQTKVELFPQENEKDLVATIRLFVTKDKRDLYLFESIKKRCTNRKSYEKREIEKEKKDKLFASKADLGFGNLILIEGKESIEKIGKIASTMERVALENKPLHKLFFKDIVWTEREEKQKKKGLYIKTLELPFPAQLFFRLIKYWNVLKVLNKVGFSKLAANGNAKVYASSGAIGVVTCDSLNRKDIINSGRFMQRIWLKATNMDLSLQPITGLLFLAQRFRVGSLDFLSSEQKKMIGDAYTELLNLLKCNDEVPIMMFRIGYSEKPSAYTSRMDPNLMNVNQ